MRRDQWRCNNNRTGNYSLGTTKDQAVSTDSTEERTGKTKHGGLARESEGEAEADAEDEGSEEMGTADAEEVTGTIEETNN